MWNGTKLFALAVLLALVVACEAAPEESCALADLTVRIEGADGVPVERFSATFGGTLTLTCPGPEVAAGLTVLSVRCTEEGLAASALDTAAVRHLVVKAPGFHTDERDLPARGACETGTAAVTLEALPAPIVESGYETGFDEDGGLARFEALAVATSSELGRVQVVKFYIDGLDTTPEVYFQDTRDFFYHYDFVRKALGKPLTLTEFEEATYRGADRTAMAGTILAYPDLVLSSEALGGEATQPITIEFFPDDDLTPAQALRVHRLLEERLGFAPPFGSAQRLFYVPAGPVQEEALRGALDAFRAGGGLWLSRAELYGTLRMQILNAGVAYGTLRVLSPEELATTVVSFRDVLVLTRLPIELPIVGGTITEELQTPLAHVNVAARSRGTPNVALLGASDDPRVAPFVGRLVRFEVTKGEFTLREATLAEATEFWDSRGSEEMLVPDADDTGTALLGFDELGFEDSLRVGAKAANLAELHALLPEEVPAGFAVPFGCYRQFVDTAVVTASLCADAAEDCGEEGRASDVCGRARALCDSGAAGGDTVAAYIARLLADEDFRGETTTREAALDGLRFVMRHAPIDPTLAATLDARVRDTFGSAPVRLRSSTNSEDLPGFSGAGLYDSVGANGGEGDEPSDEIRKVWASVWNWRAFEERAFWNIDHTAVRMGIAVHPAFPDERANGVLVTRNIASPTVAGMYVNVQLGEVSVTNPAEGAIPEVFSIIGRPGGGVQVSREHFSSLSPDAPLLTDEEVVALFRAAARVQSHFAPLYGDVSGGMALDLEFKFHGPERTLVVKQVRPYVEASL